VWELCNVGPVFLENVCLCIGVGFVGEKFVVNRGVAHLFGTQVF
jgi:hypothetical protein